MLERILSLDTNLFLLINKLPHPSFLVFAAELLSGAGSLGLVWFAVALFLVFRERHHPRILIKILIGILTASSGAGSLKNFFDRLRPEFALNDISVYTDVNDYLSFPSGHSATAFAAAVILAKTFPRMGFYFYFLAFMVAFSRVYLGVHYPLDILAGGFLGFFTGLAVVRLTASPKTKKKKKV